jgi:hypothetical protein
VLIWPPTHPTARLAELTQGGRQAARIAASPAPPMWR